MRKSRTDEDNPERMKHLRKCCSIMAEEKQKLAEKTETEALILHSSLIHIHEPAPPTAPGLTPLDNTSKIYIVKQKIPIPFEIAERTNSHYKIYNEQGEHIFTFGQGDPKPKDKFTLMELFSTGGQLIFRMVQRWEEPLKSNDADLEEILPYYRKDQTLPTIVYHNELRSPGTEEIFPTYEAKEDNPDSQVHIRHIDGTFLGHIWKGKDCWIIYDANLTPKYTFPRAISSKGMDLYTEHSGNLRHAVTLFSTKKNFSCYEYYKARGFDPDFNEDALGIILTEINLPPVLQQPTSKKARREQQHISAAEFAPDMTQVDKALVMAMALNQYCRTSTHAEKIGRACVWFCIILALLVCMGAMAGTLAGICLGMLRNKCHALNSVFGS